MKLSLIVKDYYVIDTNITMGVYHALDGITNLKYRLLYFLTPNKKNFKEKGTSF
jgi:hypothetical protein